MNLSLWSFTVSDAVCLCNRVPNLHSGMSPIELLTKKHSDHRYCIQYHVLGCTVYVLEPKIHNDQNITRWIICASLGQFLGFSYDHHLLVANLRKLQTFHVSLQYHFVLYDIFQTILSLEESEIVVDSIHNQLFK